MMFRFIVMASNDVCSLKEYFLTCKYGLYITATPPPFLFSLLCIIMLYPAVSKLALMYWWSGSFLHCVQVSVMKHISRLLSCMWCMSIYNLGLVDCIFVSAMLSFVKFHEVLFYLLSGLSRFWWIPLLLSHVLQHVCLPLFLLKFCFILRFCIWLHMPVSILVAFALGLRLEIQLFNT